MIFDGKTVVITGAGSGIGRALSIGFCADGATVIGIGRSAADLEATARECAGGRMHYVAGDVGSEQDVRRLFDLVDAKGGRVDVLINNAAQYPKLGFLQTSMEDWNAVVRTNVMGMAMCCHAALQRMLVQRSGRILNVGTFAWMGPIANSSAYSATKGAVRPLTRALAAEVDRDKYPDILINEFIPGVVRSRMSETGQSPEEIYPHARTVACLPAGGPTGQTFLQSTLVVEEHGLRARIKRLLRRIGMAR